MEQIVLVMEIRKGVLEKVIIKLRLERGVELTT